MTTWGLTVRSYSMRFSSCFRSDILSRRYCDVVAAKSCLERTRPVPLDSEEASPSPLFVMMGLRVLIEVRYGYMYGKRKVEWMVPMA